MAAAQIIALAATTVTEISKTPFLARQIAHVNSVPGATLYTAPKAARDFNADQYQKWIGDGSTYQWTSSTLANLANADTAALSGGSTLRVVVKKNGTILTRVAPTAAPTAAQFCVAAGSRGVATVTFDTDNLPADADTITIDDGTNTATIFEFDPGDDGVTGGRTEVDTAADTTAAEVAATFAAAVNGVTTTLTVTARDNGDGSVTLFSDTAGEIADLAVTTSNATDITVVDFAGDADATAAILFGAAPASGDVLEMYLCDAADIASTSLTANVPAAAAMDDFLYASAACQLIRI